VNSRGPSVTGGLFTAGNGKNQDRALVVLNPATHPFGRQSWVSYVVLCDGVGGVGDGAAAAETALSAFSDAMEGWLHHADNARSLRYKDLKTISTSLRQSAKAAHKATRGLSRNPLQRGSATTLDAALVLPGRDSGLYAVVIHVGDGVVWTLDERGLHRQVPATAGMIPEPQTLGADLDPQAEIRRLTLPHGTRLVLTSDGFEAGLRRDAADATADAVATASSVAAMLVRNAASSTEIAHCLGSLAAAHSPDDVTVVVTG
jgi:serine/threonine protein phosphatase PrpC